MFNYSIGSSQICQPCFVCSSHYQLSSGWQLRRRCAWASLRISAQNWGEREKKLQVDILMLFSLCNCTASHSSEKFKSAFFPSFFTSNGGVVYCKVTHTSEICAYIERNATTHDGLGFQSFISVLGWILRSIIKIVCTPIVKKILKSKVVSFHYVGAYLWCMQYYYYYYYI